ncbi:MAG: hypothetical protein Q9194_004754 [Teloschistes cf. exilis]
MYRCIFSLWALLALSTLSTAQSSASAQTTATLLFINADPQPLVGSIVGMVTCHVLFPYYGTGGVGCSLQGTDTAVCTANEPAAAVTGDEATPTGITVQGSEAVATSTLSGTDLDYFLVPITGGATAATTTAKSTAIPSGSTGAAAGLNVGICTLALVGAAALAAVMI